MMNSGKGKSVRLFLVDGTAGGLVTAEIINWTGKVLAGPRTRLADLLKRSEAGRSGVYALLGQNPESPHKPCLYVGEADNVGERLKIHAKDETKEFWEHTFLVVSKDENLTKAHGRYLEARLITSIDGTGRVKLINKTMPPLPPLPEGDRADMEAFLQQMQIVLPVLGLDIFKKLPTSAAGETVPPAGAPTFVIQTKSKDDAVAVRAEATLVDGEFIVRRGSTARRKQGVQNSYARRRDELISDGLLAAHPQEHDLLVFTADVPFASTSAAAAIVLNRNSRGPREWRLATTGETYAIWESMQIDTPSAFS
jgi:hypothetical protein